MDIFEKLSESIQECKKISIAAYKDGIDATGDNLKIGKTQNIVKAMSTYEEILGYNPMANEEDLPDRLGPVGQRKEAAMKEFKTVENYFRIITHIEGQFEDI